ncbi:MAG: O-antigen ligase C-terminal domain-containing protein [Rhodoferax sp.]|nr:O-antigen ligase C-terminal domain-containing protein [Rhodoferax sp.]
MLGVLLVFPWLNPWSSGPMPAAIPWLLCAGCASLVWALRFGLTQRVVVVAWWVAALLSAAIALLQYFGYAHLLSGWVNHADIGDAYANLRQRNQFATLTSIGLLALICQLTRDDPNDLDDLDVRSPWPLRWVLGLGGVLLLALGNAASGSRTGWLQWWLVAILALLWWWRAEQEKSAAGAIDLSGAHRRRSALLALAALGCYLAATWGLPVLLEATTGFRSDGLLGRFRDDEGCGGRRLLWSNVLYLIAQRPWLGWGWGELDYAHFVTLYPGARFCDILDNAHNLPLHLAVELGIPLALAACGALAWLVWRARPWRERDASRQLAWGVLAVVGLHSLVEYPLWYGPFQIAVGLCLWLLWHKPLQRQYFSDAFWSPAHARQAQAAIVFISFLAYVGWDYWRISQIYQSPSMRAEAYRSDTLNKVRNTWFFQNQVRFAELTTTPVTSGNAQYLHALAQDLLHFSPEPRVVEKLIESAVLLKQDEEALFFLQRFRAAFPQQHAQWANPANSAALP